MNDVKWSKVAVGMSILLSIVAVPMTLGVLGLFALSASVHFGAWFGDLGNYFGEWGRRAAMHERYSV